MKKKLKNTCLAIASGGALKCGLDRDHAGNIHRTPAGPQTATWEPMHDGRIKVTAFSHGKKMSEWFENTPTVTAPEPQGGDFAHVTERKVHPAADALPLLEGAEFQALVDDINVNGLRHRPVIDHTGEWLVDGRNRKRACEHLGIPVEYDRLPENTNIAAFVISTNLKRRHLTESQRAIIAAEIANLAHGQKKETRHGAGVTQAEAAAGAGVGERTVQRANAVRDKAVPELVDAVKKGKVDLKGAEQLAKLPAKKQRQIIKERIETSKTPVRGGKLASIARQEQRRDVVAKINAGGVQPLSSLPPGFGVLLWDPPWHYDNSDDHAGVRGHIKYPSMTLEQLVDLGREALARLRDDAVIVTWATNPRMPVAVHLIEVLGLTWQSMGTWVKGRIGVAPTNMRSRTEHYIIATRGNPTHTLNELSTWLGDRPIDQGEHSEKPGELHELIEQHCAGPFLELFARAPREPWTTWGAESTKLATEAA